MKRVFLIAAVLADAGAARAEPRPPAAPAGLAAGVEVGEPTSLTLRWSLLDGLVGVGGAVGSGTLGGRGLAVRGEVAVTPVVLRRDAAVSVPIRVSAGLRYYRHHYDGASVDEVDDRHTGVRGALSIGALLRSSRLEVYLEGAPGYDLSRSESCTLMSGAMSVCPHGQTSRAFVQVVLGVRWYLFGS